MENGQKYVPKLSLQKGRKKGKRERKDYAILDFKLTMVKNNVSNSNKLQIIVAFKDKYLTI